jgi:hypothetical protein
METRSDFGTSSYVKTASTFLWVCDTLNYKSEPEQALWSKEANSHLVMTFLVIMKKMVNKARDTCYNV